MQTEEKIKTEKPGAEECPVDLLVMGESTECIPCCDYCKYYKDNGGGTVKRNGFAGVGKCELLGGEVLASSSCDGFICSICENT